MELGGGGGSGGRLGPAGSARRDQFKQTGATSAAGLARRRETAKALGRDRREAAVRAKRMRHTVEGEAGADVSMTSGAEPDRSAEERVRGAVGALQEVLDRKSPGSAQERLAAVRGLRLALSASAEPPVAAAVEAGAVPLICRCLAFGQPEEQILEAAWCITNVASGDPAATRAALPAAPLLIAHCSGEATAEAAAEQCAWAIGNFAADSVELRTTLLDQGALPALARLLASCGRASAMRSAGFCRTVAWATSSLIRGPNPKASVELLKTKGVASTIVQLTSHTQDLETATEAAWIAVYACALSESSAEALAGEGLAAALVSLLAVAPPADVTTLTPVIRAVGNFCGGDPGRIDQLFLQRTQGMSDGEFPVLRGLKATPGASSGDVPVLRGLTAALGAPHRGLQKDAAWALSNIAAGSDAHKEAIWGTPATLQALVHALCTGAFDLKLESAYALANLCTRMRTRDPSGALGPPSPIEERVAALVHQGCVGPFLSLIRAPDADAARLGLQFTEMVLRLVPKGPQIVEQDDGIDALETLQFHENDELRQMSNFLVDKYYGEDYGLDEA